MNDAASMLNGLKALLPTLEKMVSATEPSLAAVTEKKRVGKPLTEEHKAKMKAGREAKKAEKAALALTPSTAALTAVAPATEAEKPKRVLTEEHKAKMKAGREAKKAEKAALATATAPSTAAVTATAPVTEAEKPKRVLTEEHKAKMKAGREAKKAEKEAEKVALTATVPAPTVVTEAPKESEGELSDSGSAGSKRGRPKGSKNKPKTEEEKAASKAKKLSKLELAASIPLPSSPVASPENVISIKGRLFVVDSNNNAYTCIGTKERGEYVGRYDKNSQIIDDSLDAN